MEQPKDLDAAANDSLRWEDGTRGTIVRHASYAKYLEARIELAIEALRQPGVDFQSRTENALRILRSEET